MCAPFQWVGQRAFLQSGALGFLNRRRPGNAHRFFEGGAVSLASSPAGPSAYRPAALSTSSGNTSPASTRKRMPVSCRLTVSGLQQVMNTCRP